MVPDICKLLRRRRGKGGQSLEIGRWSGRSREKVLDLLLGFVRGWRVEVLRQRFALEKVRHDDEEALAREDVCPLLRRRPESKDVVNHGDDALRLGVTCDIGLQAPEGLVASLWLVR